MLRFVSGDLFASKAQALVNTVNCVGVMGKGVALAFRERYPDMFEDYRLKCEQGEIRPGILTLYKDARPWVINFPTKRHWRQRSRLKDIEAGLVTLVKQYGSWGVESLAMPALGCGNGGLRWVEVRPLIERYLAGLDVDVEVYEPAARDDDNAAVPPLQGDQSFDLFGQPILRRTRRRRGKKTSG